jgi:prevent-host-death family protein
MFNFNFTLIFSGDMAMQKVSMLDFRRDAERVLKKVQKGERLILTHRGKPVARLEPVVEEGLNRNDPFYSLTDVAESGPSLANDQIDEIVYGH